MSLALLRAIHSGMSNSPPARRTARNYTTNAELGPLVKTYRKAGRRMNAAKFQRLEEVVSRIAGGVWSKWRHISDKDDFVQECWTLCLLSLFRNMKLDGNPFSYLTTCFVNLGTRLRLEQIRTSDALHNYQADYIRNERFAVHHPFPE